MTVVDPIEKFTEWFEKARDCEPDLPEAMSLSTVSTDGQPSSRMVLMKSYDKNGFVFYTNLNSRKGQEFRSTPKTACFLLEVSQTPNSHRRRHIRGFCGGRFLFCQ